MIITNQYLLEELGIHHVAAIPRKHPEIGKEAKLENFRQIQRIPLPLKIIVKLTILKNISTGLW
jgi:hypothetical protein